MLQNTSPSPLILEDALLEASTKVDIELKVFTHTNNGILEDQRTWFEAYVWPGLPCGWPRRPLEVYVFPGVCEF